MRTAAILVTVVSFTSCVGGCPKKAPTSDSTPPTLEMARWEMTPQGGKGAQVTLQPGASFTVASSWLGEDKGDIRVIGRDAEGVKLLQVSGTARGTCSTDPGSGGGTSFTSPPGQSVSFPTQTKAAPAGQVFDGYAIIHIDNLLTQKLSCGRHIYQGMPRDKGPQEFFFDAGTWTITAHAENCCGGVANGAFTVVVK